MVDGEANPDLREAFLAIVPGMQGSGEGSRLLDALLDRARAAPDVHRIVGRPVQGDRREQVEAMLRRRGFTRNDDFRRYGLGTFWVLDVAVLSP